MGQNESTPVVLVTGATRGIGKGIAIAFGEQGATVYITGRTLTPQADPQAMGGSLRETQAAVEQAGGRCIAVAVDHQQDDQVRALFDRIAADQQGQLDVLVNNVYAGVPALRKFAGQPFWEADADLWDACNQVGLRSHYLASRLAAQMMVPRRQGMICTLSSWGGLSYIFGVAYGAGKAACDRLAADMAVELKDHNVLSVSVWPGIVGTEHITQMVQEAQNHPDLPLARMGSQFNWETPLFVGRTLAALAADPHRHRYQGKLCIIAELAQRYRILDEHGRRPVSLRSLQFLLPSALPRLQRYQSWILDLKLPWWILLNLVLQSPRLGP